MQKTKNDVTPINQDPMNQTAVFKSKEDDSVEIEVSAAEIEEIVPDADFRYSLLILKNGDKHFVCGTGQEVSEKLGLDDD